MNNKKEQVSTLPLTGFFVLCLMLEWVPARTNEKDWGCGFDV